MPRAPRTLSCPRPSMDERRGRAAARVDASSHSRPRTASAPPNAIARRSDTIGDTAREVAPLPFTAAVHHPAIAACAQACTTHVAPASRSNSRRLWKTPCLHHRFEEGVHMRSALTFSAQYSRTQALKGHRLVVHQAATLRRSGQSLHCGTLPVVSPGISRHSQT